MQLIWRHWRKAADYYRKNLMSLFTILLLCFIGVTILGAVALVSQKEVVLSFMREITEVFENSEVMEDNMIHYFPLLFNNLRVGGLCILLGLVPFLFIPVIILLVNALVLSFVAAFSLNTEIGIGFFLLGIIPHGIFEIPAIVLGATTGLTICRYLTGLILGRRTGAEMKDALSGAVHVFVFLITPLFILAAVIETYFTPLLISVFYQIS